MVTTAVVLHGTDVLLNHVVMKWPASSAPADILRALPSHEVVTTLWSSVESSIGDFFQVVHANNAPLSLTTWNPFSFPVARHDSATRLLEIGTET